MNTGDDDMFPFYRSLAAAPNCASLPVTVYPGARRD